MTRHFRGFIGMTALALLLGCGSKGGGLMRADTNGQPCTSDGGVCVGGVVCRGSECTAMGQDAAPLLVDASSPVGAVDQPCTSAGTCDPGLSCRSTDQVCVAMMPDAAPLVVDASNPVGAVGQPCTVGGGCDPGLSCRPADRTCVAPIPDAAPLVIDASNAIGAVGQPCTTGGGCDPGLSCRAADRICVVPTPDAAPDVARCSNGPLGGLGIPAGTVASASSSYLTNTAEMAIDGVMSTAWNSGGFSGWMQLHFPKPTAITALHIHASAKPTTNEIYTITTDFQKPIGTATRQVLADTVAGVTLDPIPVTPGTYSDITITVNGGASWVQIHELSIINDDCPNISLRDAGMR